MRRRLQLSPKSTTASLLLSVAMVAPATAAAIEVVAVSDLATRADDAPVTFVVHDAALPDGLRPRISTDVGRVTSVVSAGGVSQVTWQPPTEFSGGTVSFRARFKGRDNAKIDTSFILNVPASPLLPIPVIASPAVAAPDTTTVRLQWRAPPSGQVDNNRAFAISTSLGTVSAVTVDAEGVASATWTRPTTVTQPKMALVTVVDRADSRRRGKLELPVQVARSTSFEVPPDAEVSIQIGDESFGPTRASPAGTVAFDLHLDPRVSQGHLTGRTPLGNPVEQVVAMPDPPTPVLHFAPVPHPGASGPGAAPMPIALAVWVPDVASPAAPSVGSADGDENLLQTKKTSAKLGASRKEAPVVRVESASGSLTTTPAANGWVLGEWMPPNNLGSVAFSAGAEGVETRTSVSVERGIAVVDGSVSPTAFTGAKRDITFTGTALGPDNSPIADTIGVRVPKGTVLARPARRGTTTTARARRHPNDETVVMVVQPPGSVDAEPVHAVLPWMVSVDDESILLRVAVVDALGRAIVKVPVSLSNTVGESEDLPETVTTDGYGMATILLAKPSDTLGVQVEAQGHRASVVWTRSGASVVGGDPTWLALASDWTRAAPTFVINATPSTAPPPATVDAQEQEQEVASASPSLPAQPKQTSSARSSQSPAWLRGGLAVQGAAYSLAITNSDPTAGPLSVTVDDGVNLAGVQGYVLGWLSQGSLGLELDARYLRGELATQQVFSDSALDLSAEDFDPDSDPDAVLETLTGSGDSIEYDVSDIDVRAGLRYRLPSKGPLTAFGLAQGQYQVARLYLWEDAVVEPIEVPLFGLRGGGGLMVEAGPVWADVQVAASFAPYPIRTEVDGRLHIQVRDPFSIHLGGGQAWRNMAYEVDSAAIAYHDELTYFSVGIGTGLR